MAIPHTYVISRCISSLYSLLNRIFDLRTYIADRRYKGRRVRYGLSWAGLSTPALNSSLRSIDKPMKGLHQCKQKSFRKSCCKQNQALGEVWIFWKIFTPELSGPHAPHAVNLPPPRSKSSSYLSQYGTISHTPHNKLRW